jgi:D-glycero-alpha-D-manno-heptose 1-phosphate guanylyltransferase
MPRAEEAIVLVGGLGTRLRDVVPDLPKPLAPVCGRPFLAYVLDHLAACGIRRTILATGYMAEKIEAAIGSVWKGMTIAYSLEKERLGTGGAIRLASRMLQGESVHIANGDTFLRFDLRAMEASVSNSGCPLGVALAHVPDLSRYGAVTLEGSRLQAFCEKGAQGAGYINAGSYFLSESALKALPDMEAYSFEELVLFPETAKGNVAGYTNTADFIDIGVPADYELAQRLFVSKDRYTL